MSAILRRCLAMILAAMPVAAVHAADVDEAPLGEAVERNLPLDTPFQEWVMNPGEDGAGQGDSLETRETLKDSLDTIKLSNLVPPIHFASGVADIPESTVLRCLHQDVGGLLAVGVG